MPSNIVTLRAVKDVVLFLHWLITSPQQRFKLTNPVHRCNSPTNKTTHPYLYFATDRKKNRRLSCFRIAVTVNNCSFYASHYPFLDIKSTAFCRCSFCWCFVHCSWEKEFTIFYTKSLADLHIFCAFLHQSSCYSILLISYKIYPPISAYEYGCFNRLNLTRNKVKNKTE